MIEKPMRWQRGYGKHVLVAIANAFCDECIVGPVCDDVCHEYSMVHRIMVSWFSREKRYDTTEVEFMTKLFEVMEPWKIRNT